MSCDWDWDWGLGTGDGDGEMEQRVPPVPGDDSVILGATTIYPTAHPPLPDCSPHNSNCSFSYLDLD